MKNIYVFAGGAAIAALAYLYYKTSIPTVFKDGFEAVGVLGGLGLDMVTDPLDTFGITPGKDAYGVDKWEPTTPWANTTPDPVSSNDSGMNFNYF